MNSNNKSYITKVALKYNLLPEEVEKLLPISYQYDLHIYDAKSLYDKYKTEKYVKQHISERNFVNRVSKWLDNDYKIYDTERFRPAGNIYKNKGYYTDAPRNSHPNSTYMRFWFEEARRSIYGYYNDGEWITGYNYFYLNYSPIELVELIDEGNVNAKQGERVEKLPFIWDGDIFYFWYLEEAERHGKSAAVLKTRGRGYSWKAASMCNRNFYLIPRSRSIIYASSGEYLDGQDGVLTKTWSQMTFLDTNTAWSKRRQKKDTGTYKRASLVKKVNGVEVETGFMSEIAGVTLKDDPDKARGKRAKLVLYEEAGSFNHLTHAWTIVERSVKQGDIAFGLRVAFGTGGEEGPGFDGLRKFFRNPNGFDIYSIPNLWTPGMKNKETAWFQPEYINNEGYYDKDGNSDIIKSRDSILENRDNLIEGGTDSETLLRLKAEQPITPEDAMLRTGGSPFPVGMLKEQLVSMESGETLTESYRGKLILKQSLNGDGKVTWIENLDTPIIETHHPTKMNRQGGIEIFEKPIDSLKEEKFGYIIGVDPIDLDYAELSGTFSLGSAFVMNTYNQTIVAEYTGRPDLADEFYENIRKLALYYNASIMYENNIKGLYTYFTNKYATYMLAPKPQILDDSDIIIKTGKRKYGFNANERINKMGRELIKKWLLTPILDGVNEETGEVVKILNLHTIRSKGLLNELIDWNPDGNFDRVSAMIALMIYFQDIERLLENGMDDTGKEEDIQFWSSPFIN